MSIAGCNVHCWLSVSGEQCICVSGLQTSAVGFREGDKALAGRAKALTGTPHALQGMMQVHQGMQYGAPPASVYQPQQQYVPIPQHQQNEQLRQFWLQQAREIQEVGTDPAEFKNHQLPLARIKKASLTIVHIQCRIGAKILSSLILIDRVKVRGALYNWSKDTAQSASHFSKEIVKDGASDADYEERRGCENDQC